MTLSPRQLELLNAVRKRLQEERDYARQLEGNTRREIQRHAQAMSRYQDEFRKKGLSLLGVDEADLAKRQARDFASLRKAADTQQQAVIAHSHSVALNQKAMIERQLGSTAAQGEAPSVLHIGDHFLEVTAAQIDVSFIEGNANTPTNRPFTQATGPGANIVRTFLTTDGAADDILQMMVDCFFFVSVAEDARLQNVGAIVTTNLGYLLIAGASCDFQRAIVYMDTQMSLAQPDLLPPTMGSPERMLYDIIIKPWLVSTDAFESQGGEASGFTPSIPSNGPGIAVFAAEPVLITVSISAAVSGLHGGFAQLDLQSGDFNVNVAWVAGDVAAL